MNSHKPKALFVCHGDSSVGTLQPLEGIGDICRQNDCLLVVDAVVSLVCAPLNMDRMKIDVLYGGAQKSLSGPPGVSLISFNDRAVRLIKSRKNRYRLVLYGYQLVGEGLGFGR